MMKFPLCSLIALFFFSSSFGQQRRYVNDNSTVGDVFTTAVGNNSNAGTQSAPFATPDFAYSVAQPGDSIFVDAGTYDLGGLTYAFPKAMTFLGANYNISPNDAVDKLQPNLLRHAESIITNLTFLITTNNLSFEGFTIDPGNRTLLSLASASYGKLKFNRNHVRITGAVSVFNLSGLVASNPALLTSSGYLFDDNRFNRAASGSGTTFSLNYLRNITLSNNSAVITGPTTRAQTFALVGQSGVVDSISLSGNVIDRANYNLFTLLVSRLYIAGNKFYNAQRDLFIQTNVPGSTEVIVENNEIVHNLPGATINTIVSCSRFGGSAATTNVARISNNNIMIDVTGLSVVPSAVSALNAGTLLNPVIEISGNKITHSGNFSTLTSIFNGISVNGNLLNASIAANELINSGTNYLLTPINSSAATSSGIQMTTDAGVNSIAAPAVININNNKISGYKQSVIFYDFSSTIPNTYTGYGNLPAVATVNINDNSFTGDSMSINNGMVGQSVIASCNWYGENDGDAIVEKLSGANNFSPWLIRGDDSSTNIGFQPTENSCIGEPVTIAATALDFDGVDDYVEGSNSDLPQGNTPRTIEAWINPNTTQNGTIMNWGTTNNNELAGLLYIGGKLYYVGQSNDLQGNINIPAGAWAHIAATFDGSTLKLYVNGVLDVSAAKSFATNGNAFRFGTAGSPPGGVSNFFKGKIDETRIWNRALTPCEIQNNMSCELTGSEPGLVGYYSFNQGFDNNSNTQESVLFEAITNLKNGSLNNFTLAGNISNWVSNSAIQSTAQCRRQNVYIYNDSAEQLVCSGAVVSYTARPMKMGGTFTYQWFKNGALVANEIDSNYSSNAFQNNDAIVCVLTEQTACGNTIYTSNTEMVKVVQGQYTFIGNGSWDIAGNWTNSKIPPTILPACSKILINPTPGGSCTLNNQQFLSAGSSISVEPGAQLKISDELMLLDTTFSSPVDSLQFTTGLLLPTIEELQQMSFFELSDTTAVQFSAKNANIIQAGNERIELNMPPAGNQSLFEKKVGSCTAWAIGYGLMGYYLLTAENNLSYNNTDKRTSPTFIWNQFYREDDFNGLTYWQALNLVKEQGICKWYDMDGYVPSLIGPSVQSRIYAKDYLSDGLEFKMMSFVDIGRIKFQLKNGNPVPIGIKVYESFKNHLYGKPGAGYRKTTDGRFVFNNPFQTTALGKIKGSANIFEKHAILICGYDDNINAFKIMNSWDPNIWGEKGFAWIDYETLKSIIEILPNNVPVEYRGKPYIMAVWRKRTSDVTVTLSLTKECSSEFTSNVVNASVLTPQNAPVYEKGLCYSTVRNPTTSTDYPANKTLKRKGGKGNMTFELDMLLPNVKYYVRAYAKSRDGIIYSNEDSILLSLKSVGTPKTISIVSGENQRGYSLRKLKEPFVVVVKDDLGKPVFNARVDWSKAPWAQTGTLDSLYTYTDAEGKARNWITFGIGGNYFVHARIGVPHNCQEVGFEPKYVAGTTLITSTTRLDNGQNLGQIYGMFIDSTKNIFLLSAFHRISRWVPNSTIGTIISNGFTDNRFSGLPDYIVASSFNSVIFSSLMSIGRWTLGSSTADSVIGRISNNDPNSGLVYAPFGFFVTDNGTIYVAERGRSCVTKWVLGSQTATVVAGKYPSGLSNDVNYGSTPELLAEPWGVFVDGAGNVYVADTRNHRIQKWAPGATSGVTVAGGNGPGNREDQLNAPTNVFVNSNGDLFIVDRQNYRIQKWEVGATKGKTVAGVGFSWNAVVGSYVNLPTNVFVKGNLIYISDAERVSVWPNE